MHGSSIACMQTHDIAMKRKTKNQTYFSIIKPTLNLFQQTSNLTPVCSSVNDYLAISFLNYQNVMKLSI